MLIVTKRRLIGGLHFAVHSFDLSEIRAFEAVLDRAGIQVRGQAAPPDRDGRMVQVFTLPARAISRLGRALGGAFSRGGGFAPTGRGGGVFACERAGLHGIGGECVTISANDLPEARVVCALLASEKGWFGGVPRPGPCP